MIEFTRIPDKLTISAIYQYTYKNNLTRSRFDNSDRDILPSKFKIIERRKYKRNKEGKYTTPEEMLFVESWSAPQYQPYLAYKNKKAKRQLQIKHHYDVKIALQPYLTDGNYSFENSKIIWRVGSYKTPKLPKQSDVKTIYHETRERLERKYRKLSEKDKKIAIQKEINKIKKHAKYISVGDYNSQVNGIMQDCYYRDYTVQQEFGCLYGPCKLVSKIDGIDLPFFDKHMISILSFLLRKGIIKLT